MPARNRTSPDPASERLDEVAQLLALGILRLRDRESRAVERVSDGREVGVDFVSEQSVCRRETHHDREER